ncbi:uncharacterized protein LOC130744616 [Lotus japonicus]|uniref:uncharacterized protein LOC130744616 n=1 Tax=Lotus japonicus TaxID=34305 RepID=UPI002590A5D7|nr:uncharacterized protein LOC130744616 [Lotus japonicus]
MGKTKGGVNADIMQALIASQVDAAKGQRKNEKKDVRGDRKNKSPLVDERDPKCQKPGGSSKSDPKQTTLNDALSKASKERRSSSNIPPPPIHTPGALANLIAAASPPPQSSRDAIPGSDTGALHSVFDPKFNAQTDRRYYLWHSCPQSMIMINIDSPVRVTNLKDAADHIGEVLKRVKLEHLQRAYRIKEWVDENDFLLQLCKSTGKLLKGGEPDLMTAAKMVLHDWQRGKIPFFVPPPRLDDLSKEPNVNGIDVDDGVASNQASAAIEAIANVLSSQHQRSLPVQKDLFSENELEGETADQFLNTVDDSSDSDTSEQDPATEELHSAELIPTKES